MTNGTDQLYNADWVRRFFDEFGGREWERLDRSPFDRASLFIHRQFLEKYIRPGDRVLELGCGAGRFTVELARLKARVVACDISKVQLSLCKEMIQKHHAEPAVECYLELDACSLESLAAERFDAVVTFGGLLSYVFDRREAVMSSCIRLLNKGGSFLTSVMSRWGTINLYLDRFMALAPAQLEEICQRGDLTPTSFGPVGHYCHLFESHELHSLLQSHGILNPELAASGVLGMHHTSYLAQCSADESAQKKYFEVESRAARTAGCLDQGTHIVAGGRRD